MFSISFFSGLTCVHLAVLNGHVEILQYLVRLGANINARVSNNRNFSEPLLPIGNPVLGSLLTCFRCICQYQSFNCAAFYIAYCVLYFIWPSNKSLCEKDF